MNPQLRAVAATQGGAFTAEQARSSGCDAAEIQRLVRSGAWARLRRGRYADQAVVAALTPEERHVSRCGRCCSR